MVLIFNKVYSVYYTRAKVERSQMIMDEPREMVAGQCAENCLHDLV